LNKYNRLSDAPKGLRDILLDKLKASALDQSLPGTDRGLSCLQIALAMIDGFGGSIDVVGALDWLMKSGELECVAAHGVAYNIFDAFKHLVPPRISDTEQKLLKWLRNAASHGSPLALRTLRQVDIAEFCAAKSEAMARFHLPQAFPDEITPMQVVEFLFSEFGWEQLQNQHKHYSLTDAMFNGQGDKILHFGAAYGVKLERFVDFLNKFKPDVDEQNKNEDTALLLAMQSGHSGHARVLLQYGAKADIPNKLGQLPSHWIIHVDEAETVEELLDLLIQRRADLSKIAERKDVDPVSHYSMIPWVGPVLHWAVLEAREDIVPILLGKGADPLQHYNGMTALHLAIKMNEHAILRHILKHIELPLPSPFSISGSIRVDSSGSSTSSWLVWSMSMAYHWHVLHHGSKAKSALFKTLDELRNAGILGSNTRHELSWAIVCLPPDHFRSFLQFLGNGASVELMAEALDHAIPQADPLVVSVVVEKILEIAPSDVRLLKEVFFTLTKSLMPASSAIESLLSVLGDVDVRNDDGDTAFASAIHKGNFVMAAEYLRLGANENVLLPARNSESNKFEVNVLHYLIALNNDSVVSALQFLLEPQHPNQVKPNFIVCQNLGYTALHVSCLWDNIAIFQILIQHFGDEESINAASKTGHTALHHSARTGVLEKVKALCELGANVNAKTEDGFTPRDLCQTVRLWDKSNDRTLEFWETTLISRLDIDEFLAKRGGKCRRILLPNAFKFLIHAVQTGKSRLFDKALKLTPEHCKSREHLDAFLFLAARQGHHEIVQKLIREGAAISCASKSSITPLHVAAVNGHVKTARVLVNSGAALYAKDKLGSSPIMVADLRDHRHVVRYFLHEASKLDSQNTEKNEEDAKFEEKFQKEELILKVLATFARGDDFIPDGEIDEAVSSYAEAEYLEGAEDEQK
jgi:ankyrin repeat protein